MSCTIPSKQVNMSICMFFSKSTHQLSYVTGRDEKGSRLMSVTWPLDLFLSQWFSNKNCNRSLYLEEDFKLKRTIRLGRSVPSARIIGPIYWSIRFCSQLNMHYILWTWLQMIWVQVFSEKVTVIAIPYKEILDNSMLSTLWKRFREGYFSVPAWLCTKPTL